MNRLVARLLSLSALAAVAVAAQGCAAPLQVEALPISQVKGNAQIAKMTNPPTGTQTRYLTGSDSLPPLAKAVQIDSMAFRSLLTDPGDQSAESLKNDALVDQCVEGRPNVDFIQHVDVGVKHKGETDDKAVLVANYTQAQKGLCGFHLTPTYFDMKDYVKDYVFVIQVTGSPPPANVSISGYYSVQDYEGL